MSIDISAETLISPTDYLKLRPAGRNGKPMHIATFYRHVLRGIRGIRLEHVRLGGQIYTSSEAVQRFAERLTEARMGGSRQPTDQAGSLPVPASFSTATTAPPIAAVRTAKARQTAHARAERQLETLGV